MPVDAALLSAFEDRFGKNGALSTANDLKLYEYDGWGVRHQP